MSKIDSDRAGRTAATWLGKAVAMLRVKFYGERADVRFLAGYEAQRLLDEILSAAEELVPMLNYRDEDCAYFIEESRKKVRDISQELRNAALYVKLSNTEGRTPEEAKAYREKAGNLNA